MANKVKGSVLQGTGIDVVGLGDGVQLLVPGNDVTAVYSRSIKAGANVSLTLTDEGTSVTIAASGTGGGVSGETSTTSNLGTGVGIAAPKSGVNLPMKSLKAGANITLTSDANEITIAAASGGGGGGGSERYGIVTGAVGDGATNDRAAFQAASAGTPSDWPIYVPAGAYNFGGVDLVAGGRRWILEGAVTFPSGKPRQGMFERHNGATGTIDVYYDRAATMFEQRTPFRLGGQSITPALNIGSADPDQSPFGSVLYADGHSNFLALKPEEPFNPMEINLYSYAYSGRANGVAGTNRLLRNAASCPASMPFTAEMVGKCLYFGGVRYKILSRVSDGEVTVAVWPSTPVIFTSAAEATYHFTYTMFRGRCSTSGTAVTWKSGHKFYGYLESWNPSSMIVIGGVPYTVSSVADMDNLTLNASAGTQADVAFVAYAEVDGETTAIRMNHAITGEQLTLMTSAGALDGKGAAFLIKTDKGVGSWNPIVMQNGGHDAMVVAHNAAADKAYVGIGENRRTPTCELDVNGMIRNSHLSIRQNSIERHDEDTDGTVVAINYSGYAGGNTRTRDLEIYNGKGALIARASGATKVIDFINTPTVGGVPISGGGGGGGVSPFAVITDFGAVGDFVPAAGSTGFGTNNDAAVNAAIASGKPLWIPAGNFLITWASQQNLQNITTTGPGTLWGSTNVGITKIGKMVSIGTNRSHEVQSVGGLLIGGESGDGIRQWMGHHNWMQWQPTKVGAPNQIQIYSSANMCTASCQAPNILNAVNGSFNTAKMEVGDHIGWYGAVYKIAALTSSAQITVTDFAGGSPGFTTSGTARPFYHAYESAEGTCNTNGTTVTYVSGEQYPYGFSGDHMYAIINGTRYTVTSGPESLDANHLTLATSAGNQTNVSLVFRRCYGPWAYVSLLRLQGLAGGVETNGGMAFTIKNQLRIFNGGDPNDPLAGDVKINGKRVILGQSDGGSDDELLEVGANYLTLGGRFGSNRNFVEIDSLGPTIAPVIKAEGVVSNMNLALVGKGSGGVQFGVKANTIIAYDAPTGFAAAIASRGADPDPDLGFDLKGNGAFRFTAGTYGRVVGEIVAAANSTSYVQHVSGVDAAYINTAGSATNIDLKLQPKGTGKTIVGSQLVANSGSWVSMSFSLLNSWTDATWGISARYRLDVGSRVVRLSGQISGGANGSKIYVLPAEYRPLRTVMLSTVGSGVTAAAVQILTDGSMHGFGVGSPVTQVVLDGLTFSLD